MRTELVRQVLSELPQGGRPFQYGILGGNAGDALIDLGFFELARHDKFDYEVVDLEAVDPSRPLVLSGGGGLVGEWGDAGSRRTIDRLHRTVPHLVVLPQTVRGNEDLLASLGEHVTFFTRERQSYEHARRHASGGARVLLDHDMAFNLDAREFLNDRKPRAPRVRSAKDLVRLCLYGVASARGHMCDSIDVRRKDGERTSKRKPLQVYNDLSFVSAFRGYDQQTIENTGRLFLKLIDRYSKVTTDRLHVGIGAFLLGKKVELVNNSNSKIQGIYDYSMSPHSSVTLNSRSRAQ